MARIPKLCCYRSRGLFIARTSMGLVYRYPLMCTYGRGGRGVATSTCQNGAIATDGRSINLPNTILAKQKPLFRALVCLGVYDNRYRVLVRTVKHGTAFSPLNYCCVEQLRSLSCRSLYSPLYRAARQRRQNGTRRPHDSTRCIAVRQL